MWYIFTKVFRMEKNFHVSPLVGIEPGTPNSISCILWQKLTPLLTELTQPAVNSSLGIHVKTSFSSCRSIGENLSWQILLLLHDILRILLCNFNGNIAVLKLFYLYFANLLFIYETLFENMTWFLPLAEVNQNCIKLLFLHCEASQHLYLLIYYCRNALFSLSLYKSDKIF